MQNLTLMQWFQMGGKLRAHMQDDGQFTTDLKASPKRTMKRTFDMDIDAPVDLRILEDSVDTRHLVIPLVSDRTVESSRLYEGEMEYASFLNRVWTDGMFRRQLMDNPKTVLNDVVGWLVPDHMDVKIMEETGNVRYIPLPYMVDDDDVELTDEDLESVDGGQCIQVGIISGGGCGSKGNNNPN